MATFNLPILGSMTLPGTSGNVWFEPAAITLQSNDRYPQGVFVFADTSTKIVLGTTFRIPDNFVSTPLIVARWAAVPTTGAVVWGYEYTAVAAGESSDPSSDQESVSAASTVGGTARYEVEQTQALTAGNFAVGDLVQGQFFRDGTSGSDTLAASAFLLGLWFRYNDS